MIRIQEVVFSLTVIKCALFYVDGSYAGQEHRRGGGQVKSDEIIQGAQGGDVSQVVSDKCFRMKPFLLSCFGFQVKEAVTAEKKCLQSGKTAGDSYIGRYLCDYAIPSRRWGQEIPVGSDSKGQCVKKDCLVNKSKCFSGIKNRTTGIQKADFYVQNSKTDLGKIEGNIEGGESLKLTELLQLANRGK